MNTELQAVKEMPKATAYVAKSMDIKEQRLLTKLVEKHGEDYHKMARDIKINVHQKTEAQLEKRIKLMQQLQAM